MKRILFALALILAVTPVSAKRIRGNVSCAGEPLAGVVISDGYRFTTSRANGSFVINTHKDARFVFVITPSGYVADYSSGAPQFYLPVKGTKTFDFDLQRFGDGNDYTLFSVSDPQIKNDKHIRRFCGRPLGDLRGMAKVCGAERPTVGIALGDIAWNRLQMFEPYKEAIATTGIPFYAVIGNHDFIQNRSGISAGESWENAFGPYNYAFWLGKDLVVAVNNIIFKSSGIEDSDKSSNNYREGYSEEALNFMKGLLEYIPKGTHIYLAQHSPMRFVLEAKSMDIGNLDLMLSLLDGYQVDVLSGHTHIMNKVRIAGNVMDNNAAAIGGAWWAADLCRDGTPRGWEIISSVGGDRSWLWHNIDYPDDFQVQFIGMDKSWRHRNSVVANAWCVSEGWTCTWTQDGEEMGPAELCRDYSSTYRSMIVEEYGGVYAKVPHYLRPIAERHYYVATPSQYASFVTMTVNAPDGRSWSHTFDLRGSYTDLQAHRGGAGLMPENTLSSMKNALDLGVNTLEFDLQLSSDGKVVVSHDNYFHPRYSMRPDSTLVNKEDPREYLYTMPYDSIARYDVGLRPVEQWPQQKKVSEHKPLASDLIRFAEDYSRKKGLSPVRYNIEIKSRTGKGEGKQWPEYKEFCDKCMEVLLPMDLGDRLVVQSFDTRALEYVHSKYPEVNLSYLTGEKEKEIADILSNLSFTPRWWSPHHSAVTRQNVAYCHALGIRVVPWTVDKEEDIRRMADCKVDAIISNYPDRLVNLFRFGQSQINN